MEKKKNLDKFALYLAAVQDPLSDVIRISKIYEDFFGAKALTLREDFCGTFALSCCWAQSDANRSSLGIDIDRETIDYGLKNYWCNLSSDEQSRVEVWAKNAISQSRPVDLAVAFNFSYCLLRERSTLLEYFQRVLNSLNEKGMLIVDVFGGSESEVTEIEEREIDDHEFISPFLYQFERKSFNPINRESHYGIHFIYPDGTELIDAFTYHFRMWTITELRDLLLEAGFSQVLVYWEDFDEDGFGNGQFYPTESEENTLHWNAYVVGIC